MEISIIFFCPFEHCRVRVSVVICNTQNVIVVVCFFKNLFPGGFCKLLCAFICCISAGSVSLSCLHMKFYICCSLDHFMGLDTSVLLRAEVSGCKGDRKEAKRRLEDIDERVWSHFNHAQQCAESKIEGFFLFFPQRVLLNVVI